MMIKIIEVSLTMFVWLGSNVRWMFGLFLEIL